MHYRWLVGVCCALCASVAMAQYSDDNESYTGDADGEDLNAQSSFYNPVNPDLYSNLVYTYQDNTLGITANPTGGDQFVGGTGPGGGFFLRSQNDATYGDGTGVWRVSYDIATTYTGVLPASQNLGSLSTQAFPGAQTFIALATWTDINTAETWDADIIWFSDLNAQLQEKIPNVAFQKLAKNHWYRLAYTFDLDSHKITEVAITDLATGDTASYEPAGDRYLYGGSAGGPAPTGFRYFSGGGTAGNTMAFDNLVIEKVVSGAFCNYKLKKAKAKKCDSCPAKGDTVDTNDVCEVVKDCPKKYSANIDCPGGGNGSCKLKGKRSSCG